MIKPNKFTPSPRTLFVLGGAVIGAAAFILLYGFSPLDVTNDVWLRGGYVERDTIQHYAGWLFYRDSAWSWPLGVANNMGYPSGGYVGFTDSIPIFAVFFKLLSPLLPETFQYFGLWAFLCHVLQGATAAALLSLFTENRSRVFILCTIFVTAPILLDRQFRHGALGAQWLIVLALYLYFKHRRSGKVFLPYFWGVCALTVAIHPYFTPMVFALFFALLVENAVAQRQWWQPLCSLCIALATTLVLGWCLGLFSASTSGGGIGFGYFSMNLNAPVNPSSLSGSYSLILPPLRQNAGQYDGFNYLGFAVLASCAIMVCDYIYRVVRRRNAYRLLPVIQRHYALLFVCVCLAVFAVSSTAILFERTLISVELPQFLAALAATFRSSGRLFYPVWYVILLTVCIYWLRRPAPKYRMLAACILVAVQLVDLSPALMQKATSLRSYTAVASAPSIYNFLQSVGSEYEHIVSLDENELAFAIDIALFAADNGMTTNDVFFARYDAEAHMQQVASVRQALAAGEYSEDTLYITCSTAVFEDIAPVYEHEMICAQLDTTWYILAPYTETSRGVLDENIAAFKSAGAYEEFVLFEDYSLTIAPYSDVLWDAGVLTQQPNIVCFYDTAFARSQLSIANALRSGGELYPILSVSYEDAGWILVELDTQDACVLRDMPLEAIW